VLSQIVVKQILCASRLLLTAEAVQKIKPPRVQQHIAFHAHSGTIKLPFIPLISLQHKQSSQRDSSSNHQLDPARLAQQQLCAEQELGHPTQCGREGT
jgi:hypothetical protein